MTDNKQNNKAIFVFVGATFGITWLIILVAFLAGVRSTGGAWTTVLLVCMFVPAVCSLLARKSTGEGTANMRIKPRFRGNWGSYILALALPAFCIICGSLLYFLIYPSHLDVGNAEMVAQLMKTAAEQDISMTEDAARGAFYSNLILTFIIAPVVNILVVFGEELGWRGYLLQKLANRFGPMRAVLFSGVIWGVWHAPMIIMGHNYGVGYWGYPLVGIGMMVLFCVVSGALMSYLTLRTGSVIPACLIHSTFNAVAGVGIYFISIKAGISPTHILLVGPTATGILGMSVLILVGALYLLKSHRLSWDSETEQASGGESRRRMQETGGRNL